MPMIELINHSPNQASWNMDGDSIAVQGQYKEEILVRYSVSDPLRRLFNMALIAKNHLDSA